MKKLNITFCSFPDYAGNAKALYEYMVKKYKNNMNYTWIVYDKKSVENLNKIGVKAILIGTDEFKKYIPKTNVFFTTHANLAGDKLKAKKSIYVELWHGIGPKPVGFLTKNLSDEDYEWYTFLSETIDYFIVPSDMWRSIFSAMFNIKPNRIPALGFPIYNEIKNSNGKEELSKILNIDVSKYSKIIYYMPTFKKGCGRGTESKVNKNNILNFDDYNDDQLVRYLKKNNYLLVVKRHPSDECKYNKIENEYIKNIDNKMLAKRNLNVNNILNAADILITDYSSLGLEFSMINRPVIYISTDLEEYKNNRGIIFDNYDFWTKNRCNSYKELEVILDHISGINNYDNEMLFGNLSVDPCETICNYFFDKDNKVKTNITRHVSKIIYLKERNEKLKQVVNEQIGTIKKLTESDVELEKIKNSRGWKMLEMLRKPIKKIKR